MTAPAPGARTDDLAQRALWLLPFALLALNLGGVPLFDVDEGAFASATREMLASGDWLSTTLNGAPRFDKPIMIYWLQALSVGVFGFHEWSVRLPSVLAAGLWCVLVGRFARERLPAGTAGVALVVAATSIGVMIIGRAATADALLNLLLTAACLDGYRYLADGDRTALRRTYAWVAIGILTKGPIAVLVPGAAIGLYGLTAGRWRELLRGALDPVGLLLLVAIALPWYVAALMIHGQAFIDGFILKHNVERAMTPLHGHRGFVGFQLAATLLLLLPWTPVMLGAAAGIRADFRDELKRFLWIWFLFVLLLFTVVSTKLPHYVLYGATPLFLLIALKARVWAVGTWWQRALLVLPAPLLIALLPAIPSLIEAQALGMRREHSVAMLGRAAEVAASQHYLAFSAAFTLAAVLIAVLLWRRTLLAAGALAVLLGVNLVTVVAPYVGELMQGPTQRAAMIAKSRTETIVLWHFPAPTFSAYLGRQTPARPPVPGELAFTRQGQVPPEWRVEVLFRQGGVELVKVLP